MDEILDLVVCSDFFAEVEAVIKQEGWTDVQVKTYPRMCGRPGITSLPPQDIITDLLEKENVAVINCQQMQPGLHADNLYQFPQCYSMLVNQSLIDDEIRHGQYIMTPGWLKNWQKNLDTWGITQETARQFFHKNIPGLLLLDTGLDEENTSLLASLADYLDLPARSIPVGLDFLRLTINQIVSGWRNHKAMQAVEKLSTQANRAVSDYAMVIDLLTNLTQIRSVEQAHRQVADLFTMMFFEDSVFYLPVENGRVDTHTHALSDEEGVNLEEFLLGSEPYQHATSGTGFYLRIEHLGQTLGLLVAENLTRPEYLEQYLNLSLMIAGVCALSISNASNYQKLLVAEAEARKEREISNTLLETMHEMASELSLKDLFSRILYSLHRVIPYSEAMVFLRRGTCLEFSAGLGVNNSGEFINFSPDEHLQKFDAPWLTSVPLSDRDLENGHVMRSYLNPDSVHSWIGLPLMKHREIIGYLSIGNRQKDIYTDESVKMAQAFGAEVSIAIENARLFSDLTEAAITDGLTGLFNRRHFFTLAGVEFTRSKRYQRSMSVVIMDIDFFKQVNDRYGHLVGDQVLKWFAGLCKGNKRISDILARYGGEEFILLLPEIDSTNAVLFAERLRKIIAEAPAPTSHGPIPVTCSMGVAELTNEISDLDTLLGKADTALYDAKRSGRNRVCSQDSLANTHFLRNQ